jgi:hypothetical protein
VKGSEDDLVNYSHNVVRGLTAEQLLDAQSEAAGVPLEFGGYPEGTRAGQMPLLKTGARRKRQPARPVPCRLRQAVLARRPANG